MSNSNQYQKYQIIRASKEHLQQIWELDNLIFKKADRFSKPRLRYLLSSPNTAFFICLQENISIGYGIALRNKLRNGKVKGRIYSLGVLSKWQNKGAGKLLLKYLEDWLLDAKSSFITLETRKGQSGAKCFFEKMGYKFLEILPNYYESVDGIRMKKIEPFHSEWSNNSMDVSVKQLLS